ncbi:phosphate signaling complex protein PhoU [Candidatus Viridilinea mediisalina]|uniref:Phosphate-specific transport system accessory protein PhoU n=1 Tax=Candidatus Viridilinea mediisalina TaxID=2024553 RepID=A0A2A6RKW4_9CHLR|nr:phosphate signaling complex protein PhoU [Candidatus Viridilinea mediisalina]PDW03508.1 phosphate transport system regulatory protein PhoU [Candidatus Viridilinea mediisalina]
MLRERYAHQIGGLRDDLLRMGSMVEQALLRALKALDHWDTAMAAQVISDDSRIDEVWRSLEERTIMLLATQQPIVASDLRLCTVVTAIAGELERIGDYANAIARRVRSATKRPALLPPPPQIQEMAELTLQMVHTSLEAFLHQDVDLAHSLTASDERVDELEDRLRAEIIANAKRDPDCFEAAIDMIDVVHALERSADRATNIGERVIYLVTSSIETIN